MYGLYELWSLFAQIKCFFKIYIYGIYIYIYYIYIYTGCVLLSLLLLLPPPPSLSLSSSSNFVSDFLWRRNGDGKRSISILIFAKIIFHKNKSKTKIALCFGLNSPVHFFLVQNNN